VTTWGGAGEGAREFRSLVGAEKHPLVIEPGAGGVHIAPMQVRRHCRRCRRRRGPPAVRRRLPAAAACRRTAARPQTMLAAAAACSGVGVLGKLQRAGVAVALGARGVITCPRQSNRANLRNDSYNRLYLCVWIEAGTSSGSTADG
jgi:hypothetical protein